MRHNPGAKKKLRARLSEKQWQRLMRRSSQVLQLFAGVALICLTIAHPGWWSVGAFAAGVAAFRWVERANTPTS
jgi:fatty acid desaturase